ncbi:exo-alpha-sialidase [Lacihabitans sp. LS3-19]|uniref:sialidase family protein n=1 Tax=Lacihabitans sp. LS3-19 TaxID=2487335 RepID=UPI0020CF7D2F|nr:sialidase family protein [Lacihabitans sp. LS3-19]MCP9769637.1 exo-alpha-sialidase [Lacihabitans sp. LS3-19]
MFRLIFFFPLFFLSIWNLNFSKNKATSPSQEITICNTSVQNSFSKYSSNTDQKEVKGIEIPFENDPNKTYSSPLLANTSNGEIMISWTEKDEKGIVSFCVAFSKNKGETFSKKNVIFSGTGIGNSRMMRAKVLSKRNGGFVAIFANREESQGSSSGRGGRSSNIVFCESKDGGKTWSQPANVDSDPKKGIVRGFFDAVVMTNDEIAVSYLKDVANSTKREERDLRLVLSKNGIFQPERLIDPVVCDCCPINFMIGNDGSLNVIYRDNNDNIRDMAKMTSYDNGLTFSKPEIIFNDKWEINGCPHNGAVSTPDGNSGLVSWFSGSDQEMGIRLTSLNGKKIFVLDDATARNQMLVKMPKSSVLLWEQNKDDDNLSSIALRTIVDGKSSETIWVENSANSNGITGLNAGDFMLIASESIQSDKKNKIKISKIRI